MITTVSFTVFLFVLSHSPLAWKHNLNKAWPWTPTKLFGEAPSFEIEPLEEATVGWRIYIDQSKSSLDRGAGATLDAFLGLCPPSEATVVPAILPKSNQKCPWIRCVSTIPGRESLDVSNVDSVDKVYRILTKHLQIDNISPATCACLKWKYIGNNHLESGEVEEAIQAYDKALSRCDPGPQMGVLLLLRSTAFSQRANACKVALREHIQTIHPEAPLLKLLSEIVGIETRSPPIRRAILGRLQAEGKKHEHVLQETVFHHGLYRNALLLAVQDALRATEILPSYAKAWYRAGELLLQSGELQESERCFLQATNLEPTNENSVWKDALVRAQQLNELKSQYRDRDEDLIHLALNAIV